MKLKLLLLLLIFLCTFIIPALLLKSGKRGNKEKPGERRGHKHGKRRGRVEDILAVYDDESDGDDDEDDDERGEWLFELQHLRGNCNPNPCLNNGVCEDKKGTFKCKCPKSFKGRTCEKTRKVCKRKTCGYGQCVLTSSPPYFECKCIPPFKPPDCKKIAPCEWNPCVNGGTCEKDGQDFDCICNAGFSGKFCQVGPNDCYEENGESYRGLVSETEEGEDCLFWNSHRLLGKGINPFDTFNDPQGLGPHNYCRNPDGESKPWCFIQSGKKIRWDHCDVRKCPTDPTTTTYLEPKPTTVLAILPLIRPIPLGPSESPTPGSAAAGRPTPGSAAAGRPTPGSAAAGRPTPGSPAAGRPTPGSPAAGRPTPGSDAAGRPTPGSDTTGTSFPGSEDVGSNTPGSATAEEQNTGDAIPGSHTPGVLTPLIQVLPTILPADREFATCGEPQPKRPINRIYGGIKALPGGQPWQASVQVKPKGTIQPFRHVCGGTLIKSCWVLTAGHCIEQKNDLRVVLGSIHLGKNEPFQQTLEVAEAIVHEQYRETFDSVQNDIALLRLKDKNGTCATENQFVKTACLPTKDFPDGTVCSISGWGATTESQHGSSQLLDAEVLLISQRTCTSHKVYGNSVDNNMFCAGYLEGGVDACQGDSGGPLTCVENLKHYIYGIVSWGDSCGLKNKPGVYTRVTQYVDWINRITVRAGV
ncbi:hyaluronan-binding protein 2-like [Neoarius graeffei]|uniref:hyaluronan-binding protein 2-like n=1 Tax=Neoarius graeffei TaxID=443677 RepID=UPI00298D3A75|nr:hyaluronan-binding protein 2-like [Neoarius graeffei]